MPLPNKRQQSPVPSAQIKNPPCARRNEFQQRRFAVGAVRDAVGTLQVIVDVLARSPQIDGASISHEKSIGKRYTRS